MKAKDKKMFAKEDTGEMGEVRFGYGPKNVCLFCHKKMKKNDDGEGYYCHNENCSQYIDP